MDGDLTTGHGFLDSNPLRSLWRRDYTGCFATDTCGSMVNVLDRSRATGQIATVSNELLAQILTQIEIIKLNGESIHKSGLLDSFLDSGFELDGEKLILWLSGV